MWCANILDSDAESDREDSVCVCVCVCVCATLDYWKVHCGDGGGDGGGDGDGDGGGMKEGWRIDGGRVGGRATILTGEGKGADAP